MQVTSWSGGPVSVSLAVLPDWLAERTDVPFGRSGTVPGKRGAGAGLVRRWTAGRAEHGRGEVRVGGRLSVRVCCRSR